MPQGILRKAHYIPAAVVGIYALVLALMTVPVVQKEFIYLNRIKLPWSSRFDNPESYGLAPGKTRNFHLDTPDGEVLGAWHVLPHSYYTRLAAFPPNDTTRFDVAFGARPTILYLHGNAETRTASHRVRGYMAYSSRLDCNVVTVDYRGFADSTGTPSQAGITADARAAYDWVAGKIAAAAAATPGSWSGSGGESDSGHTEESKAEESGPESNIIVVGHSLGTGVAAQLAASLADDDIHPRAIALIAPFFSIASLLDTYYLFGIIPILRPLSLWPWAREYFRSFLVDTFESNKALQKTRSPILLLHARDDPIIAVENSERLFNSLVGDVRADRALSGDGTEDKSQNTVTTATYPSWGTVTTYRSPQRNVVWWEGKYGGHNRVGWAEGTYDLIGWVSGLGGAEGLGGEWYAT